MTLSAETGELVSFGSYVGGHDVPSERWVYALSTRALLNDSFASLTLKRNLERNNVIPDDIAPGVVVGRVALADRTVIADSLTTAAEAAKVWREVPLSTRVDGWLELLYQLLVDSSHEIEEMLTLEGHPLELAAWEISGMFEATRKESREFLRGQLWQEFRIDGRRKIVRRQPDGVVCVNPPANAPMVSALLAATSIAAGNAVVVRVPRSAPFGVMYVLRNLLVPTLEEIGAPPGIFNAVCGNPGPMLDAWLESPAVNDIMYFGDVPSGKKIERRCVEAGKKPILELAGNDVVLVWRDANPSHVADSLAESFFGSGQLCMIPNQAIVHPDIADELIEEVAKRARALRPGYPDERGVLLSPVLRHDKFNDCLADAVSKGARVIVGGSGLGIDGEPDANGFFLQPTVIRVDGLENARRLNAVLHETFFPLLPIVVAEPADDERLLERFIDFANSNLYGLRNSVWATSPTVIDRFLANITNGGLLKINESHIAFSSPLPTHGGTGLTGGVFGEANYPVLRTTHLQGVSIGDADAAPSYR